MQAVELMQALQEEKIDFELLPFDLEDILYSRYSKSVCDKFSLIDLNHLTKAPSPGILKGTEIAAKLYLKKILFDKYPMAIQMLSIPAVFVLTWTLSKTKFPATFLVSCVVFLPLIRCLSLGYLTKSWNETQMNGSR